MSTNIFAFLLCLLPFSGLAQNYSKDPFIGLDKTVIIKTYGFPTAVQNENDGGQILIYKRGYQVGAVLPPGQVRKLASVAAGNTDFSQVAYEHTKGNTGGRNLIGMHTYTFTIDRNGKVSAWKCS